MNQLLKLKLKPVWVIAILGITVAGCVLFHYVLRIPFPLFRWSF